MSLDLSFARAALVLPREFSKLRIFVIGAGGTGSYAAPAITRLAFELRRKTGKAVEITIIDPDRVESGNIPRSNFCAAEIGKFKAQTLAERITLAWGLEIGYSNEKLEYENHIKPIAGGFKELTILVGCVDNHQARREIHRSLEASNRHNAPDAPATWWIDGGNGRSSGQVLIGSTVNKTAPASHFTAAAICRTLPAPSAIHPELLENQEMPVGRELASLLSCAERVSVGEQSLNINQRVATEISEMLTEFLLTNNLKRFATYFDLESGSGHSLYCTPEHVEKALKEAAAKSRAKSSRRRKTVGSGE